MGNVCCTGRTNHTLHHSPQGSETNLSKKNSEQSFHINKKTLKKSESPKQPFVAYEWQNLFVDTGNQEVKENTEIFMSIRGNKEDTKASYTSRQYETQGFLLEYYLLEAKDLDKTQQAQVLQILDIYQRDITEEETEELDGVLEDVQMNGSLITVMLTTHAVYLLNSHDWLDIIRRVTYETIKLLTICERETAILFHISIDNYKFDDVIITSKQYIEIIKATEQLYYEFSGDYISWHTVDSKKELLAVMNKPIDSENDSHEYKNFVKTIVRYGDIGEKKIKFQPCSVTIDSYNCDKHFLLTDKAIYALSNDYMLVSRILLESIIKIGRDSDKRAIVVFQKKNAYFFRLPLVVADNILDAALNIGISKIDVEDLEDDSYTNLINN